MVFSSAVFLFIFLPVVILLHTVIQNIKVRNGLLIVASLVFYAFGEPVYVLMLIGSVAVNYIFGTLLARNKNKAVLAVAVVVNLALLVVFKYTGFLVTSINQIFSSNIPVPDIVMPIGISFYTFQAISYVIDTYRSEDSGKQSFFDVLLYISLFPQLIAGPIVKYNSIKDEIKTRMVTTDGLLHGIRLFVIGLAKKVLIANTVGYAADTIFSMNTSLIDMPLAWFGAICYTLQIYFDFSGYSDMALGIGRMMGFTFPKNFDHPYVASGIRVFWRKWHMSLTAWFREYLYIPLGGNRKGIARQILNSMIVFTCTGIWHGANVTFIVWGVMHGILISVETLIFKKKEQDKFNVLKWIYTMIFVVVGFAIFRADDIAYAMSYVGKMFSFNSFAAARAVGLSFLTPYFITILVLAAIACTPVCRYIADKTKNHKIYNVINYGSYVVVAVLLLLCIMNLASTSYNPFIYFRF